MIMFGRLIDVIRRKDIMMSLGNLFDLVYNGNRFIEAVRNLQRILPDEYKLSEEVYQIKCLF